MMEVKELKSKANRREVWLTIFLISCQHSDKLSGSLSALNREWDSGGRSDDNM